MFSLPWKIFSYYLQPGIFKTQHLLVMWTSTNNTNFPFMVWHLELAHWGKIGNIQAAKVLRMKHLSVCWTLFLDTISISKIVSPYYQEWLSYMRVYQYWPRQHIAIYVCMCAHITICVLNWYLCVVTCVSICTYMYLHMLYMLCVCWEECMLTAMQLMQWQ